MKQSLIQRITGQRTTAFLFALSMALTPLVAAEMVIDITQGVDDPTPIAIVPFGWSGKAPSLDMAKVISSDLRRSGLFESIPRKDMLGQPHNASEVHFRDWRAIGADYVVVGTVKMGGSSIKLSYALMDVLKQQAVLEDTLTGKPSQIRDLTHAVSDKVYERITGIRGAFSTKILYVSAANRRDKRYNYRLYKADADGAREKLIVESEEPLLSPTWAPNGKELA